MAAQIPLQLICSPAKAGAQDFSAGSLATPRLRLSPENRRSLRSKPARLHAALSPNAKGARHCCQAPCRRTSAVDPDGSSAWFRRLRSPRRQGHANLGSVVEAGRCPLIPKESCGYQPRRPASSSRPGAGTRKPCWTRFSPFDPFRTLRSACASLPALRSLRRSVPSFPVPSACAPFPRTRVPHPFRLFLLLRAALACRLPLSFRPPLARRTPLLLRPMLAHRAPLPVDPCPGVSRNFRSAWAALPFRNYRDLRIPEPFPNVVSRRHQHRFRPM